LDFLLFSFLFSCFFAFNLFERFTNFPNVYLPADLDSNALSLDLDFLEKAGNKSVPPLQPETSKKAIQKHTSKSTTQSPVLPIRSLTETPLALQQDLAQSALIQQVMQARAEQRALAARAGVPVVNKNGAKKCGCFSQRAF
jgi:hypothetical protein